jgi:addiction module HigA family antidote
MVIPAGINMMPPIHPGEILREDLEDCGLTPQAMASALCVSPDHLMSVLGGQCALTADLAWRLARYFGTSAEYWLNLQSAYELGCARQAHGARIMQEVRPRDG